MSILNKEELFCEDQVFTAAALCANVIDNGLPGTPYGAAAPQSQDIGKGAPLPILIQPTLLTAGTATSATFAIETGSTETLGTVLFETTLLIAEVQALVDGQRSLPIQCLPNGIEQFLGVRITPIGGTFTGMTVTAGISMGNQTNFNG